MKIEQKISLLGLKKYLRDESQQSLITAYIKLLKNSVKISPINVKTSGYVHYINYYLKILNSMHKIHKTWRQAKITWENGSQDLSKPEVYHNNQADVIEAFNSTSRYLDDLLNIDSPYFEGMVKQIYPPELQLNKANNTDTEAPFLDLHLSIANGFVSSKFMINVMTLILI